jgi:hypothetical protein
MNVVRTRDCWGECGMCGHRWTLGCVVPCPVEVYLTALKVARCPLCGEKKKLYAYSPGQRPGIFATGDRKAARGGLRKRSQKANKNG